MVNGLRSFLAREPMRAALACTVLFVGTLLLFGRAATFDFIILDDPAYVTDNPAVQGGLIRESVAWAFTAPSANWHPLTWMSHMLDWQIYGAAPRGHHLTSVLWHALNATLVFLMFRRFGGGFWLSGFAAAVFAWHPLRAESVAWIAERKDVMSGCFFLLTILAYSHYVGRRRTGRRAWPSYLVAVLCYIAGLMSKPMLVSVPLLLLVLDAWPWHRLRGRRDLWPLLLEKVPFFTLSGAVAIVTVLMQREEGAFVLSLPLDARTGNAVVSVMRYIGKLFWPVDLTPSYPHPGYWPWWAVLGSSAIIIAITVMAWIQRRERPWVAAGWLWYLISVLPVLGLLQVGRQAMADRYTYLPTLGLELGLFRSLAQPCSKSRLRLWAGGLMAVVILGLGLRTWVQLGVWRDSLTLFQHAVTVTPGDSLSERYLASALLAAGRVDEAASLAERVSNRDPRDDTALVTLAGIREAQRRFTEAIDLYRAALEIRPDNAIVRMQMGLMELSVGRAAEAHREMSAALRAKPALRDRTMALAGAAMQHRDAMSAYFFYRLVLSVMPDDAEAHVGLGAVLLANGEREAGLAEWRRALELDPDLPGLREHIEAVAAGR